MGVRSILLPWDIQPQDVAGINWDHPRARGLCLFVPGGNALGFRDLVRDQPLTLTGLTTQAITSQGPTKLFGTSSYADFTKPPEIGASTPFTVAWTQEPRSTSSYSTILNVNFGTAGVHYTFILYEAASDAGYYMTAGPRIGGVSAVSWSAAVGAPVNNQLDRFVLTVAAGSQNYSSSNYNLWRNGVLMAKGSNASFGLDGAAAARIGARESGSDPFEGLILDVRMWARVLSDDEAAAESHVDGAVELYEPEQINGSVASAAGSYTLTAAAGSFTLTGSAAGLKAGRRVTAAAGSFTLTGNAAGLYRGLRLSAAAGTYAWTGNAANLLAQRKLLAAAGSYVLTGNAAVLRLARMLAAASGTYTLTGNAADLIYSQPGSYSLAADPAAFTLTGQAAGLRADRRLPAAAGVFNLTGSVASLLKGYRLAATVQTYALTGQAATLSYSGASPSVSYASRTRLFVTGRELRVIGTQRILRSIRP